MEKLYDYLFWYNHYERVWYAIHREYQLDFFSGKRNETQYLKSSKHSTLVEIICKSIKVLN
jgi:hypothetical protein